MSVQELKELSPFLAVIVSILAVTIGPFLSAKFARDHAIAGMRETWIYRFRDCLVELTTELDVLHEGCGEEGIMAHEDYEEINQRLRALENRVRLMVNTDEELYANLMASVEEAIDMLMSGIRDYEKFHIVNARVKDLAQSAVRNEWKKVNP